MPRRKLALLIGVDQYQDPEITQLRYAGSDVRAVAEALRTVCGFHQVRLLTGGADGPEAPTKARVLAALRALAGELRPEDLFLLFFAGHGIETGDQAYLLTSDSQEFFPEETGISLALLRKNFVPLAAGTRVLVLDACRNDPRRGRGDSDNLMGAAMGRDLIAVARGADASAGGSTTVVLSACATGQRAYEFTARQHGVFTHYLLEGMHGAAWDGPVLRLPDLARYTAREVGRWSSTPGRHAPQTPWYEQVGFAEVELAARARSSSAAGTFHSLAVAADGSTPFLTITQGIAAAAPGAIIRVRPGVYREAVVLHKDVEIVGTGPRETVIIECDHGHAVRMAGPNAVLRGLTIRCTSTSTSEERQHYGIEVGQGRLVIEECDVTSSSNSSVEVHGLGTSVEIRRCKLHDSAGGGLSVHDHATGVAEDCEVSGHAMPCVWISAGGDGLLRRCKVRDGRSIGVLVDEQSKGALEDCDIFGHAEACVAIGSGGDPVLRRCKIHGSPDNGVLVLEHGKGTLEDCDIFGHAQTCVGIGSGGDPMLRRCKIHDSPGSGVDVVVQGKGTLEDCDIFGHAKSCVAISSGGDPMLRRCNVHDSPGDGVFVHQGKGTLEDCDIFGHAKSCVAVSSGGDPMLRRCKIHDSAGNGVQVVVQGKGTLEDCDLFGHAQYCVGIGSGGDPVLRRCKIHDSPGIGVFVLEHGKGTLENCDIFGHSESCVHVSGDPVLRRCKIHDSPGEGVWVDEEGNGTLEDCDIFGHAKSCVYVRGDPVLRQCKIHDSPGEGVWVVEHGKGTLEDCDIFGHSESCVYVCGDPVLRRCKIRDSPDEGVWVGEDGKGTLEDCDIFGHSESCVTVGSGGNPVLRRCKIHDGKQGGVLILNKGRGTFENCELWGNVGGNFFIRNGCEVRRTGNKER